MLKTASFTVHATVQQSVRWKQFAEAEGHSSVGAWLAGAADAYLKQRAKTGAPIPLAWHWGSFPVRLLDGEEVKVAGYVSPPFAYYLGTAHGPLQLGRKRYTLVHLPTRRLLATLRHAKQARTLASDLAPVFARDEQAGASVVERHAAQV